MEELIKRLATRVIELLPPDRRELGDGLLADAAQIADRSERLTWLLGGLFYAFRCLVTVRRLVWIGLFLGSQLLLLWVNDYGNTDVSSQYCLAILLVSSVLFGSRLRMRLAWLPGIVPGLLLAVAGVISLAYGWRVGIPHPATYLSAVSLAVLVLPGIAASCLGAHLARAVRSRSGGVAT